MEKRKKKSRQTIIVRDNSLRKYLHRHVLGHCCNSMNIQYEKSIIICVFHVLSRFLPLWQRLKYHCEFSMAKCLLLPGPTNGQAMFVLQHGSGRSASQTFSISSIPKMVTVLSCMLFASHKRIITGIITVTIYYEYKKLCYKI